MWNEFAVFNSYGLDRYIKRKLMLCGRIEARHGVWISVYNTRSSPNIIWVRRVILSIRNEIVAGSPEGTRPLGGIHTCNLRDSFNQSDITP